MHFLRDLRFLRIFTDFFCRKALNLFTPLRILRPTVKFTGFFADKIYRGKP
jgi:hypothetical protein